MDPGNGFPGTGRAGSKVDPDRADPGKLIRVPGGYRVLFSSYFFPTFPILLHFYVTIFFKHRNFTIFFYKISVTNFFCEVYLLEILW